MPARRHVTDPPPTPGARRWWRPSEDYERQLRRYSRVDMWLALGAVAVSLLTLYLKGLHDAGRSFPGPSAQLAAGFAEAAIWLLLLGTVVALRRQGVPSLGFARKQLVRSLLAGAVLAVLVIAGTAALGLLLDGQLKSPQAYWFTWGVPYYLVVIGFQEELLWRGFVTPRLAAQFTRRWIGVLLAAVLFGLMHLPYQFAISGLAFGDFMAARWLQLIIPMAWHFLFWWLYARWNSLAAPTLVHWAMNWSGLML